MNAQLCFVPFEENLTYLPFGAKSSVCLLGAKLSICLLGAELSIFSFFVQHFLVPNCPVPNYRTTVFWTKSPLLSEIIPEKNVFNGCVSSEQQVWSCLSFYLSFLFCCFCCTKYWSTNVLEISFIFDSLIVQTIFQKVEN